MSHSEKPVAHLDGQNVKLEEQILHLYDASVTESPQEEGIRYRIIDPSGVVRTVSKHKGYDRLKYHLELKPTE